jgi:hypothetical protein
MEGFGMINIEEFKKDLKGLINRHSLENRSNTPDYIIADYLFHCLLAFETVTNRRDKWYGNSKKYVRPQDVEIDYDTPSVFRPGKGDDEDMPRIYNKCAGYYESVDSISKVIDLLKDMKTKGYIK